MKVCEIFDSIDGEGPYQGMPATFIRLAGCNLRCAWCDTTYSYGEGHDIPLEGILEAVRGKRNITVTGGEPLIQEDTIPLLERLVSEGHRVSLETNGSKSLEGIPKGVTVIMDWKCPSSGMGAWMCDDNLNRLCRSDEIKFVAGTMQDIDEAYRVMGMTQASPVISPLFSENVMTPKEIAEEVIRRGNPDVRLRMQIHKVIWSPDTRGV